MACVKNISELINIDFSTTNDEFNWVDNVSAPIQTVDGKLLMFMESSTSEFRRSLGAIDPAKNRIRLQVGLELKRLSASIQSDMKVVFGIYAGTTLIDEFSVYKTEMNPGEIVKYNLDREYYYADISGNISLKITTPEGYSNRISLEYLLCQNYNYCDDDIRTYFAIESLVSDVLGSTSSGLQLLEWKVDGSETLTADFFADNNVIGGDPLTTWKLSNADIDGKNRVSDDNDPKSFNPFVNDWGLTFDNIAGNFYGGKPTGTTSGKDYGTGILQIGFEKPEILNGNLEPRKGVFFIDIDYTKNLKIVFNVIVNDTNADVFNSPRIFRTYYLTWNASSCEKSFYYFDNLEEAPKMDVVQDGFLSGLSGFVSEQGSMDCSESMSHDGELGVFEFTIDFGTDVGECGIDYIAGDIPEKFEIEWNGNVFSSGYVGLSDHDQSLINLGVNPSEINTNDPSSGTGQLKFIKTEAEPQIAIIRVTSKLSEAIWQVDGICPIGVILTPPTVDISTVKTTYEIDEEVSFVISANDADGSIASWSIDYGDGTNENGSGVPSTPKTHTYTSTGAKMVIITVTDDDGLIGQDTVALNVFSNSVYSVTGTTFAMCGSQGMSGTLTVTEGSVVVWNFFLQTQGNPISAIITIDGTQLDADDTRTLGVGVYPFTSTPVICSNGIGSNFLTIT